MGRLTNWEKQVNRSQQAGIARKTNQAMRKAPDESGGLMCYLAVVASDVNKTACATTLYLLCLWQRRGRSPTRVSKLSRLVFACYHRRNCGKCQRLRSSGDPAVL